MSARDIIEVRELVGEEMRRFHDDDNLARVLIPERVAKWVAVCGEIAADDEAAHSLEDQIWHVVLLAVANGNLRASELATEALATVSLDFARWCA